MLFGKSIVQRGCGSVGGMVESSWWVAGVVVHRRIAAFVQLGKCYIVAELMEEIGTAGGKNADPRYLYTVNVFFFHYVFK